jgi:Ca-activated chloride channel family protein
MSLTLDAALDRPLIEADAASERYLMLSLRAAEGSARRVPLNLALVVDASGSMSGEKLARAKEAAGAVVRHLSSLDRIALIAYNDDVKLVAPSTLLTPQAKTDLLYHIGRIETGGMTNLSGGWLAGCQEVAKHQDDGDQLARVLVLTDGLANVGITSLEEIVEHARELRVRGIVTSTMGVGADFNEELLEALARHGGGRFQYVETAKHIPDCVQGELGEMLQVAARKVAVEVALPDGIRCVECLNDFVVDRSGVLARVHLGDVIAGDTRRVLLQVAIEPTAARDRQELTGLALYVDSDTGRGTEQAFPPVELVATSRAEVEGQVTNEEVAREVALLLAARAKEQAASLVRKGDDLAAVATLGAARVALAASPYAAAPAFAAEIAALDELSDAAQGGLKRAQVKELHYSSYLAREGRRRFDLPH